MFSLRSLSLSVLASALLIGTAAMAQNSVSAARIVNSIDEKQLTPLNVTTHPLANARNDRGAAPDSTQLERMHLVLKRSDSQEKALRKQIEALHTPGTASYHKWLTPEEFGKQFGPSDEDIATVKTWLAGHGFSVTKVNPGKQTIEFSGNVAQMRATFHTQIHQYEVDGQMHYANAGMPQIPAALAPVVGGFVSLNNFHAKRQSHMLGEAIYDPRTGKASPQWTTGPGTPAVNDNFVLSPADYAVQYDLNPLYTAGINGTGQTIAIVNDSNVNIYLVNQFRKLFGLPVNPPQVIIDGNDPGVDGVNNPDGPNYDSIEAYLDVEWSGAVAPNATVDLVIGGDTELESGLILAAEHAVYGNVAPVLSLSFGYCESGLGSENTFLSSLWEQAAAQGITVLVSSGDNGSAGCDDDNSQYYAVNGQAVSGFASTPFDVAVGGTDFYYSDFAGSETAIDTQLGTYWNTAATNSTPGVSIKGVIPEQPWNDSQYGDNIFSIYADSGSIATSIAGGSGGASSCATGSGTTASGGWAACTAGYPKPAWQSGTGVPADGARDIPDLSLFAANGLNDSYYPECWSDADCQTGGSQIQITGIGGTSASAPSFAGVMALVNQKYGRQGQADFVLYPLATQFPAAFHDVKVGTNSMPCALGTTDCISVTSPLTVTDPTYGSATEGQIGTGTTPEYNATAGYDLASGLGTIDAATLIDDWNKVTFTKTTTTLTPSSNTFAHGTAITVQGSVTATSGTPTGDVALMTDSTEPVQQGQTFFTLSGGNYSGSVGYLPGGTYNIWGQYGGDSKNGLSSSTPVSITVSPENSTLGFNIYTQNGTFTSSGTPGTTVDYGTQFLLGAQPQPSSGSTTDQVPTGTVTFKDGATVINTAIVNAEGDAEYNAGFSIGKHSVTASYSGDPSYNSSAATAIPFTVVQDTPVINVYTTIQDGAGDFVNGTGQPTIATVTVENGFQYAASASAYYSTPVASPTGSVTVTGLPSGNGTVKLSPGVDASDGAQWGVATFTIPAGSVSGNYSVTASYTGDTNYAATSVNGNVPVVNLSTSGLLTSSTAATLTGTISPTTNITITGTVTGQSGHAAPTGLVYVYSSAFYLATVGFSSSSGVTSKFSVTLDSRGFIPGTNQLAIQYGGDAVYDPSAVSLTTVNNTLADFTLVPNTTIVSVKPGSSATVNVNLASVNGFSGAVSLSCTAATGTTCTIPSSESLTSGGIGSATVTIGAASGTKSGSYDVLITGKDATGKFVHTLGLEAAVANTTPSFTLSNGGNIAVQPGATTGNTSIISATPSGGFTGVVDLNCAVTTAPAGATSPVTCGIPPTVNITGTSTVTGTLTASSTSSTTLGAYAITVTGKDAATGTIVMTTVVSVTVMGTPSFRIAPSPGLLSFGAGAATGNSSTVTVTPVNGFTATVDLSCAVTTTPPTPTSPATCSFASGSVAGGSGTDLLTIHTTATTSLGAYVVTITATSGSITKSTTLDVTVTTAPSFTLSNNGPLSIGAGVLTGNTVTVTVTPSNGFTGTVDIMCLSATMPAGAIFPATCGPVALQVTGGSGTDAMTIVTTSATTLGTYTFTVSGTSGSITKTMVISVNVTAAPSFTLSNGGPIGFPAGATSGNTAVVTVAAANGFSGAVTMNCAVTATPAGATSPATCLFASGSVAGGSGMDTLTVTTTNTTTVGAYTVTVTGTSSGVPSQITVVTANVTSFKLTNSGAITVKAGATSGNASTISVTPSNGFTGAVALSCAITPVAASDPATCSFATASIAGGTGTDVMTVTTTAPTTSRNEVKKLFWPSAGGAALALVLFFGVPKRRRNWLAMLGLLAVFVTLGAIGCGGSGGGGGGGGTTGGTSTGNYTVTVTGTSQGATQTTAVALTVN